MKIRTLLTLGLFGLVSNAEARMSSSQTIPEIRTLILQDSQRLGVTYQDISAATRTMFLEDGENMDTIAAVLKNRYQFDQEHSPDHFCGSSLLGVIKCPRQFGVYSGNRSIYTNPNLSLFFSVGDLIPRETLIDAYNILTGVLDGTIPDRTKGATHFGTKYITSGTHLFGNCYAKYTTTINGHKFYKPNCR